MLLSVTLQKAEREAWKDTSIFLFLWSLDMMNKYRFSEEEFTDVVKKK